MRRHVLKVVLVAAAFGVTGAFSSGSVAAEDATATYRDIEQTLGVVPGFFKSFPESGIAGAWAEFKSVQLNPSTALSGKTKELIGLAVAAQIPLQLLHLFPHGSGLCERRECRRDSGSGCHGGDHPALEHCPERDAGGSRTFPPGHG